MVVSHVVDAKRVLLRDRVMLANVVQLSDNCSRGLYSLETYVSLHRKYVPPTIEILTGYQRDVVCHG